MFLGVSLQKKVNSLRNFLVRGALFTLFFMGNIHLADWLPQASSEAGAKGGGSLSFFSLSFSPAAQAEGRCNRVPRDVVSSRRHLGEAARKIKSGQPLRIVIFGSSSVEGTPDIPKSAIFASVFQRELVKKIKNPIDMINKGRGGDTIAKMLKRLDNDVFALEPDLLIWQLGVNDVLQMDGVNDAIFGMKTALQELKKRKIPVILVDLQVSPMVDKDRDTPMMQAAIEEAGSLPEVTHFHRYKFMRYLIENKEASLNDLVQNDGLHMTPFAHFCTGKLLAEQVGGQVTGHQTTEQANGAPSTSPSKRGVHPSIWEEI